MADAKDKKKDDNREEELQQETPAERRRRRRIGWAIVAAVLGAIVLAVAGLALWQKPCYVPGAGFVTTPDRAQIPATDEGPIESILVADGQRVEKAQLLFTLTNRVQQAHVELVRIKLANLEAGLVDENGTVRLASRTERANIDLTKAKLQLLEVQFAHQKLVAKRTRIENAEAAKRAKAELDTARQADERIKNMADSGLVPVEEVDAARLALELTRSLYEVAKNTREEELAAGLAELQAQTHLASRSLDAAVAAYNDALADAQREVAAARAGLAVAQAQHAAREVRSPLDGFVSLHNVELGETVNRNTPLAEVFDDRAFLIKAKVRERYLHRVRPGQTVRILFDAYPEHYFGEFWGTVQKLSKVVTPERSGGGYVIVHVQIDPTQQAAPTGMSADISIEAGVISSLRWLVGLD